ncbi:MAG: response regulator [Pseudomonadota bacterium]
MAKAARSRPYMTPKEVAAELMVTPETVRLWVQKGLLKAELTAGGHRRFKPEDVTAFARSRRSRNPDDPLRLLIVDDERQIVEMLYDLFETSDFPVVCDSATSGFEAGRKVVSFSPDVMLLDLMMPGIDGFEVCAQVHADRSRHVHVIAMTGFYSPDNVERVLAAGAAACLPKPLDLGHLEHYLRELAPRPAANTA